MSAVKRGGVYIDLVLHALGSLRRSRSLLLREHYVVLYQRYRALLVGGGST
jgi:hypothetical protein